MYTPGITIPVMHEPLYMADVFSICILPKCTVIQNSLAFILGVEMPTLGQVAKRSVSPLGSIRAYAIPGQNRRLKCFQDMHRSAFWIIFIDLADFESGQHWQPTLQVLADFVFVPGEQLKYGESPVIGSIEQEHRKRRLVASYDVWFWYVTFFSGNSNCSNDTQEISGEGVRGAPYMPPAYFTRRSQTSRKVMES